jgi:hypothetical protein
MEKKLPAPFVIIGNFKFQVVAAGLCGFDNELVDLKVEYLAEVVSPCNLLRNSSSFSHIYLPKISLEHHNLSLVHSTSRNQILIHSINDLIGSVIYDCKFDYITQTFNIILEKGQAYGSTTTYRVFFF